MIQLVTCGTTSGYVSSIMVRAESSASSCWNTTTIMLNHHHHHRHHHHLFGLSIKWDIKQNSSLSSDIWYPLETLVWFSVGSIHELGIHVHSFLVQLILAIYILWFPDEINHDTLFAKKNIFYDFYGVKLCPLNPHMAIIPIVHLSHHYPIIFW